MQEFKLQKVFNWQLWNNKITPPYTPPYKVYTATLRQLNTDPPVATVMENTIGNIVWSYQAVGIYVGTLTGAFTIDKTATIISGTPLGTAQIYRKDDNTVYIQTHDLLGNLADTKLGQTTIEIKVYN